jgi:hypothetical protein
LWPPPNSSASVTKGSEAAFSLSLLVLALVFIWTCRSFSPDPIRHWFAQVPLNTPFDLLLLPAAVLAAILLHEAGHLLASLLLGFRILGGSIGPFQIQMIPGDSKISWSWKTAFTGSISAVPRGMHYWRQSMMTVISAGPALTLISGLMAASYRPSSHLSTVLQVYFVQVSALLFVLGLIPNGRHARRYNDARLLLDLLSHSPGADELELKVRLKQLVLSGERPQDYPRELIIRLAAFRGRPDGEALFAQALVQWSIDSGELELADAWDRRSLALAEQCAPPVKNSALASSACFDVIFRQDYESARTKFAQVDCDSLFPSCLAHRARAARLIASGRRHRAPAHILRAQYALPRGNAHYALERTLLDKLHGMALQSDRLQNGKFQSASA